MTGSDELVAGIEELDSLEDEERDVDSDEDDDVLGAGAALPVLPKQKDCTHPKYACVLLASQPD